MTVLLDTNALMMPSQFRIDLFEELRDLLGAYEPVVLVEVVEELRRLSGGHGKEAAAARLGLEMSRKCTIVESGFDEGTVDGRILGYAGQHGGMVLTNDRALRNQLLIQRIPVISLKNQKKLGVIRR
ncbi:MAG: nucleotide-binding protein [Methanomicrobiales archaeon]|nr:nucleotide-binding protein [Methanomicrobiales archaeon]